MSTYAETELEKVRRYLTNRNTENMFSITFIKKTPRREKENQLVNCDQNVYSLCSRHHYVNNSC